MKPLTNSKIKIMTEAMQINRESESGTDTKKYSKAAFERAVGLPFNSIYHLIKTGKIREKKVYTQRDVDKYLERKQKSNLRVSPVSRKMATYTPAQIAQKLACDKEQIYALRKLGRIAFKNEYSEAEVLSISGELAKLKPVSKVINAPIDTPDGEDYDPFEIHSDVDQSAKKTALLMKLVAKMKALIAGSTDGVIVKVDVYKTQSRTLQAINEAKVLIAREDGFKDDNWKVRNFKDKEKAYTHSYIQRLDRIPADNLIENSKL